MKDHPTEGRSHDNVRLCEVFGGRLDRNYPNPIYEVGAGRINAGRPRLGRQVGGQHRCGP